jgi:hypothetical protein
MKVDLSPEAIADRIRTVSERSDLRAERRVFAKVDMSGEAVARRIRAASEMLGLCRRLGTAGRALRTGAAGRSDR